MRISYVSDLHLEFRDYPNFEKEEGGDLLLLAGDILTAYSVADWRTDKDARKLNRYLTGPFKELINKYEAVFYIAGNHEYYNAQYNDSTRNYIKRRLNDLELNRIQFLEQQVVKFYDLNVIATTLWSDYEKGSPISMATCERGMNDYRIIFANDRMDPITTEFMFNEHKRSLAFIREVVTQNRDKKYFVMTHHAPTSKSLNQLHIGNGLDGAYYSDLSEFILDNPNITHWLSGHTHIQTQYDVGDTVCISNCMGYRGEICYDTFNGLSHLEIEV